ncbi:Hypothetical predicted protein, partial [Paramuricea clavata]
PDHLSKEREEMRLMSGALGSLNWQRSTKMMLRQWYGKTDVLTRYVKLVAASDNSAETAVRVLIDQWITQFDIPEVTCDRL